MIKYDFNQSLMEFKCQFIRSEATRSLEMCPSDSF